jgi:hypothetical protein
MIGTARQARPYCRTLMVIQTLIKIKGSRRNQESRCEADEIDHDWNQHKSEHPLKPMCHKEILGIKVFILYQQKSNTTYCSGGQWPISFCECGSKEILKCKHPHDISHRIAQRLVSPHTISTSYLDAKSLFGCPGILLLLGMPFAPCLFLCQSQYKDNVRNQALAASGTIYYYLLVRSI